VSQSETFERKKPKQVSPVKQEYSPEKPQVNLKRNRSESADEVPKVVKRTKRTVEDTIVKESEESSHD
jgi:hypothetical protein